jgi:hypothetical protein
MKEKILAAVTVGLMALYLLGRFDVFAIYSLTYLQEKPIYYKTNILSGSTQVCELFKNNKRDWLESEKLFLKERFYFASCYPVEEISGMMKLGK